MSKALGLIEVIGFVAAIEAADSAVKSANVNILDIEKITGGIVTVKITGDIGAVKSAVEASEAAVSRIGTLRSSHVIPRVSEEVFDIIKKNDIAEQKQEDAVEEIIEDIVSKQTEAKHEAKVEEESENVATKLENDIVATEDEISKVDIDIAELTHETLLNMSVKEVKKLAKKLNVPLKPQQLKKIKKDELIQLIMNTLREEDK